MGDDLAELMAKLKSEDKEIEENAPPKVKEDAKAEKMPEKAPEEAEEAKESEGEENKTSETSEESETSGIISEITLLGDERVFRRELLLKLDNIGDALTIIAQVLVKLTKK